MERDAKKCEASGYDGFLSKPLSVDRFPGQLGRILSGEQVWELR